MEKIGFGGGCHWCTEAVFQALRGVSCVEQGFIASNAPNDSFSEAVIITFDPEIISLSVLMDIHLRTHASGSSHSMRKKYRSAVYVLRAEQAGKAQQILGTLQAGFDSPRITHVLDFVDFKASEARFQNYHKTDPQRPFCKTYIDPKLAMLRRAYSDYLTS